MYLFATRSTGLKAGAHMSGTVVDPNEPGEPDPAIVEATVDWARRRFPGAGRRPSRLRHVPPTRPRPTIRSCSSGTGASSSPRPALATASVRARRRGADRRARGGVGSRHAVLPAPRRPPRKRHVQFRDERHAPDRGGDGPRGLLRERVDPLPPHFAVPRAEARRLRADRARGVGSRRARAQALLDVGRRSRTAIRSAAASC